MLDNQARLNAMEAKFGNMTELLTIIQKYNDQEEESRDR